MQYKSTLLALPLACLAISAQAADLGSGTLSLAQFELEFGNGPNVGANVTPDADAKQCIDLVLPCDTYTLTVDVPEDLTEYFPTALYSIHLDWDAVSGVDDYDLYLYDADGNTLAESTSFGGPEAVASIVRNGVNEYTVEVVHYAVIATSYTASLTLDIGAPSEDKTDEEVAAWLESNGGTGADSRMADACVEPGLPILEDASDDTIFSPLPSPLPGQDLQSLNVFQTTDENGEALMGFQLQVDDLTALTPQTVYFVSFLSFGDVRGVRMEVDQEGNVSYLSYIVSEDSDGDRQGHFVDSSKPAHALSNHTADGVITIYTAPSDVLLYEPGNTLSGFNAGIIVFVGAEGVGFSLNGDTMPDGLGRSGQYEYLSKSDCQVDARSAQRVDARASLSPGRGGSLHWLALAGLLMLRRPTRARRR